MLKVWRLVCSLLLLCTMCTKGGIMKRSSYDQSRRGRNSRLMKWGNVQSDMKPLSIFRESTEKVLKYSTISKNIKLLKQIDAFDINHNMPRDRKSKDFEDRTGIFSDQIKTKERINNSVGGSTIKINWENKLVKSDGFDIVMDVKNLPDEKESPTRKIIDNFVDETSDESDDNVCVKKVMQVAETVYEDRVVCHHTVSEKCHHTFLTEYVPTLERKCQTSYRKKCNIQYKPTVHTETVRICREPLQKFCSNTTVGEVVCRTYYETVCQTRYKELEVEEDKPVCKIITERKCHPPNGASGFYAQYLQSLGEKEEKTSSRQLGINEENCTEWPVKKCTLEKTLVNKVNPETSCNKMSRNVCAPSNCILKKTKKICQDETQNSVLNIPTESCDLEPQEDCSMETVLIPRLVQKPRCLKVPQEICVNTKGNPKKVLKPVIKEWCYKPSELKLFSKKRTYFQ
eukprot:TRINITY_DN15757_c0_g1_i5.p1 TRINITY_DN15757_c0_g1~~TRINITY_DN15757_c0_g1_i5.p1  ORF type:complete len:457 (-),score=88.88 TRINITY_DN15757_c0_g1_i5:62-1432(-)